MSLSDKLYDKYKCLHESSKAMYEWHAELQSSLAEFCFNKNRKWNNSECEIVSRRVRDPFNCLQIAECCAITGRTPYSVFNCFIWLLWREVGVDNFSKLKRAHRSARKNGIIEKDDKLDLAA